MPDPLISVSHSLVMASIAARRSGGTVAGSMSGRWASTSLTIVSRTHST